MPPCLLLVGRYTSLYASRMPPVYLSVCTVQCAYCTIGRKGGHEAQRGLSSSLGAWHNEARTIPQDHGRRHNEARTIPQDHGKRGYNEARTIPQDHGRGYNEARTIPQDHGRGTMRRILPTHHGMPTYPPPGICTPLPLPGTPPATPASCATLRTRGEEQAYRVRANSCRTEH